MQIKTQKLYVSQLTRYEKQRFKQNVYCPICGEEIYDYDEVIMQKRRHNNKVSYKFCHSHCVSDYTHLVLFKRGEND